MSDKQKETSPIIREGKYCISLLDDRNWVVTELKKASTIKAEVNTEDFDTNSSTYHPNLKQAILELADRMTKDQVKKYNKNMAIGDLVTIMKDQDSFIRRAFAWRDHA